MIYLMKVIIVGGGIAGLSAATLLCEIDGIDVTILEKSSQIGGQAQSTYTEKCNVEYSWRIFGFSYTNLMYIITQKLKNFHEFKPLVNSCFVMNNETNSGQLNFINQAYQLLKFEKPADYNKLTDIIFMDPKRAEEEFQNVNALEYFNNNPIIHTILGPFLGMDANKVSLSGAVKNINSIRFSHGLDFVPKGAMITKSPTQDSLFSYWREFLVDRGVKIKLNYGVDEVELNNRGDILGVSVNGEKMHADQYIFGCSLKPINKLFSQMNTITFNNMRHMEKDLQLYFTVNLYFNKEVLGEHCEQMIIVDMPWKPIIQRKTQWSKKIMDRCNSEIKEVWNVGFLDYNPGVKNPKILRECSLKEAVEEGVFQVKNSEFIKTELKKMGMDFNDIFEDLEYWHEFRDQDGKVISENPKFSINVGTMKYMPKVKPADIPSNMYLCGYYVESYMGGVSMEASCQTGLDAARTMLETNNIPYDGPLPFRNDYEKTNLITPFINLDKHLYKNGKPHLGTYVNTFALLVSYLAFIILIPIIILVILIVVIIKKYSINV